MQQCSQHSSSWQCAPAGQYLPPYPTSKCSYVLTTALHRPLKAFWMPLATFKYKCIDEGNYMMSFAVITIFLDFILLFLPMPIVWALQLPLKQRIAVCGLFFLGFIVCIAGIIQAYFIDKALIHSYDETWAGWPLWIASAVEVDLGIVSRSNILCRLPH
jgi:hypothetical protein